MNKMYQKHNSPIVRVNGENFEIICNNLSCKVCELIHVSFYLFRRAQNVQKFANANVYTFQNLTIT